MIKVLLVLTSVSGMDNVEVVNIPAITNPAVMVLWKEVVVPTDNPLASTVRHKVSASVNREVQVVTRESDAGTVMTLTLVSLVCRGRHSPHIVMVLCEKEKI